MSESTTAIAELVAEWELRPDGDVVHTPRATVLPVQSHDGAAVLKVGAVADDAHLVLRRWNGDGAARLLRADPHRRALLLERLRPASLETQWDVEACQLVGELYGRLHVAAMPQLPMLPTLLDEWAEDFTRLPRNAPIPHRLVEQATTLCRDFASAPADTVLHGNLHYANVLAAEREPWLAISPTPINGDPHYELAPMLWNRWDELAGYLRDGVRQRFYALVDAAGFDADRARAWVIVRVVREAERALTRGDDRSALTRYVTLAKAVQD